MSMVCFHKPGEENGWFSNWYLADFTIDGGRFTSIEQYMMYRKAVVFRDEASMEKILGTTDPERVKELGKKVKNYNDTVWNGMRQIVVYRGLLEKFGQNQDLREKLLGTGDAILAECAVKDRVWGIGLSMEDPDRFHTALWRGKNLLGFSLMMAREALR